MKRSELRRVSDLAKRYIEEERIWGQAEFLLDRARAARPVRYENREEAVPASPPPAPAAPSRSTPAARVDPQPAEPAVGAGSVSRAAALDGFRALISGCRACPLGETRLNFVFGVGNPEARLMFIGEGPGFEEDHKGEPFVGKAGQLLNRIIEAIGMKREDVYIANIVKCHPMIDPSDPEKHGNDRPPTKEESAACLPHLERQIAIIRPAVICALGNSSVKTLLGTEAGITRLRGRFHDYKGIRLMPTYHPAALLRNPSLKKETWEDMKMIRAALG